MFKSRAAHKNLLTFNKFKKKINSITIAVADNCSHNQLVDLVVLVAFDTDTPDNPADIADDSQDNQLVVHAEHMAVQQQMIPAGMGDAVA